MKRQSKEKAGFWGSWQCNVLLLVSSLVIFYGFVGSMSKYSLARDKYLDSEQELKDLEENKEKLERSIQEVSSPFGEEKVIRDRFNVVKEGESLIVIVDNEYEEKSESGKENGFIYFIKSIFSR